MTTANTLEVRKIVKNLDIGFGYSWTDKCADANMRLVAFEVYVSDIEALKQKVVQAFTDLGYDNRVKITVSPFLSKKQFLRIKANFEV
jgi:hypothetical protein